MIFAFDNVLQNGKHCANDANHPQLVPTVHQCKKAQGKGAKWTEVNISPKKSISVQYKDFKGFEALKLKKKKK